MQHSRVSFNLKSEVQLLLGAFFPLVLVIGFGLLVAISVIVRETRLLFGEHKTASSKNLESHTAKHSPAKTNGICKQNELGVSEEQKSRNEAETDRVEIPERESDNEWLAEIAIKLDPSSPEDVELLKTARTMQRHANYTMWNPSELTDRLKHIQG